MLHPHDIFSLKEPWTVRIRSLAQEISKAGHRVFLAYFPLDYRNAYKHYKLGEQVEVLSLDRRLGVLVLAKNLDKIFSLVKRADIVHFQKCYYYVSLPALLSAFILRKPVHYDWDDWETKIFYYSNPKQKVVGEFIDIFERLLPLVVDTVSVSSRRLRGLCIKRGMKEENIFWAPVGADTQEFRPRKEAADKVRSSFKIKGELVIYAGQLHGGQYAELFIKASCKVLKAKPSTTFMIVGDGYRKKELENLAEELGVRDKFIFTGAVEHSQVPEYINAADVCVACFEDNDITRCKSPLKIAEYLACGKTIVASDVGEVRRMVGPAGIVVKAGDYGSLAEGIIKALNDPKLREKLEVLARKRSEEYYNWGFTAKNILSAYRKALS